MRNLLTAVAPDLVKILVTFALVTIAGGCLASLLQHKLWERQIRVDLFRNRYLEGTKTLDELSRLIDRRHFALQRWLWALKGAEPADKCEAKEREYFATVSEWGGALRSYRNKIRLLVGNERANGFLDYRDDTRTEDPQSLHYMFVKAHNSVVAAKANRGLLERAQHDVHALNHRCSRFLEDLTNEFAVRASALELLKPPSSMDSDPTSRTQ